MRSDFIGNCPIFVGLPEALNVGQYLLPRLRADEIRDAVEGPAGNFGASVEKALIDRLVDEMGINPDQLPLMQHAMSRTWASFTQRNSIQHDVSVTLADYNAIGGITNSLSHHAESIYDELVESERRIAELMFRSMCEVSENGALRRRLVTIEEISMVAGASIAEVVKVTGAFSGRERNLLVVFPFGDINSKSVIDITHEALLRNWALLRQWIAVENESAKQYKRIEDRAKHWRAKTGSLLDGPELEISLKWMDSNRPTEAWMSRYGSDFRLATSYLVACRMAMTERLESNRDSDTRHRLGTKIFISYRRLDAEHAAGRIYDRLCEHFGDEEIFYDVDTIKPGVDFPALIETKLSECAVLLVLIGNHWLEVKADDDKPRLDDPKDWVRLEIETALTSARSEIHFSRERLSKKWSPGIEDGSS